MNKSMYMNKNSMKDENYNLYAKIEFPDETLAQIWKSYNWDYASEKLLKMQCSLSKVAFSKNFKKIRDMQIKITNSTEARMLAVKKVSEEKNMTGVDHVRWRSSSEKMRAAISLSSDNYKAKPYRHYVFMDEKCGKERVLGVPAMYDRAMEVLYSYALEPISEAWGDRKSFSGRKGRSIYNAHATLCKALQDKETGEWALIADVKSYYDTISHEWLLKNIPMNKNVLREFLKCGMCYDDGTVKETNEGISLGCNLAPILSNMVLNGLQEELYKEQKTITDYKNGWCLRFADDIIILAKSKQDTQKFRQILEKFCEQRGLKLNEEKTKIVNIKQGFEFLSRLYIKEHGILKTMPSEKAVESFENSLNEFILSYEENWSQRKLIKDLNYKLRRLGCISQSDRSYTCF